MAVAFGDWMAKPSAVPNSDPDVDKEKCVDQRAIQSVGHEP